VCTAVFVHSAVRLRRTGDTAPSSNAVQAATATVTVAAIITWPAYSILLVPIIAAARLYYSARFGITYPGPGGVRTAKDA
jgi:hypothetical protein